MPNVTVIHHGWRWSMGARRACEGYELDPVAVEAAAGHPAVSVLDTAATRQEGFEIRRHTRDGVTAWVGFRHPDRPVIVHCDRALTVDDV